MLKKLKAEQTSIVHKVRKLLGKKAICIIKYYTNIDKVKMFHVLHNKVALLTRRRSERGTRNRHQRTFRKVGP